MCAAAFTDEKAVTTQDANAAQNFSVFQSEWKFCLVLVTALHIEGLGLFGFFPYPNLLPCSFEPRDYRLLTSMQTKQNNFFGFYDGHTWECHPQTL